MIYVIGKKVTHKKMLIIMIYSVCDLFELICSEKSFVCGHLRNADIVGQMIRQRDWVKK
jgi:hypothetical protein